jgi:hypothetical protein
MGKQEIIDEVQKLSSHTHTHDDRLSKVTAVLIRSGVTAVHENVCSVTKHAQIPIFRLNTAHCCHRNCRTAECLLEQATDALWQVA